MLREYMRFFPESIVCVQFRENCDLKPSKNIEKIAEKPKSELIYGYFDTVNKIDNQTYIANGWAILPERGEVADGVILTYENAKGEAIIFKLITLILNL